MTTEQCAALKNHVITVASNPPFKHHTWYKTYHLDLVHKIALELIPFYPKADETIIQALIWLHDYEKCLDFENQYNTELTGTKHLLTKIGVAPDAIALLTDYINQFNAKDNLKSAPIEIQIVSSSDGAAHLIGPFYTLYWYENPTTPIDEIMAENLRKATVDWDKKIVLPEIQAAFKSRHQHLLEMIGKLPDKFLI